MLAKKTDSIFYALNFAKKTLQNSSQTPSLDAELLLCFLLGISRADLICHSDKILTKKEIFKFKDLIKERQSGCSVAQITGKKAFWKSEFIVTKNTLCPRSDTEILIESVLKYYRNKKNQLKIVEFGTGTGCIVISLLKEYKNAIGYGFEKSQKTFYVTKKNIKLHNLKNRTRIFYKDLKISCQILPKVDIIVSNPPYIKKSEIKNLQKDVQKEPRIALDGGFNGMSCYKEIFKVAKKILKKNGSLFLEIGDGQERFLKNLDNSFFLKKSFCDLSGKVRAVKFCSI